MSISKSKSIDFGFQPNDTEHHFLVYIKQGAEDVYFFEQFSYVSDLDFNTLSFSITGMGSTCKSMLKAVKWQLIANDVRAEFNRRLKDLNMVTASWKHGFNHLHRLYGKEIMVLVWAIEDADPGTIPLAIQNWLGLKPEERWWLYTITNAATGNALRDKGKGWRKALRFALTENPVTADRIDMNLYKNSNIPSLFEEAQPEDKYFAKPKPRKKLK
jgi:hypothetical protein